MQTYCDSCHCQAVQFELDIDLSQPGLRCNCSYCVKVRSWAWLVPGDAVRVVQGEAALATYQFGARRERHHFCSECGVRVFGRAVSVSGMAYATVSVTCLDALGAATLEKLPVRYVDGANDCFDTAPANTGHL